MRCFSTVLATSAFACAALSASASAQQAGQSPNLGARITQSQVLNGGWSLKTLRTEGRRIFTTPFNKLDGHGEAYDHTNPDHTSFGNRPTLQNNGTFLRVNGLDGQTCLECHTITSNATIPATLGVGGVGGISNSPMFMTRNMDPRDSTNSGFAAFDGRLINPPFLFGAGGIEAVGKEMTSDLQKAKQQAFNAPNTPVALVTKGVNFGTISYDGANYVTTGVVGVEPDLVVRPFGRKGEFHTTRAFDRGAMQFHFGIQPVEVVGAGVDGDHDGVVDELTEGEMSVLHIFANTNPPPRVQSTAGSAAGLITFQAIGCAECHRPELVTDSRYHTISFPDVETDPSANIYLTLDLKKKPLKFSSSGSGVSVPCFADLKRHDMGPRLAESFGAPIDAHFTTARLWGVADTAPYLHDGRALNLTDAIVAHGGEAQQARDNFVNLTDAGKIQVLALLRSLRTPEEPNEDLGKNTHGTTNN